jgi:excisionase family DNA binding protein
MDEKTVSSVKTVRKIQLNIPSSLPLAVKRSGELRRRIIYEDRLWSVDDVAEYLGLSRSTIYRAVSEDRLPCIKVWSAVRFRKEAIDEWLDKQAKKKRR